MSLRLFTFDDDIIVVHKEKLKEFDSSLISQLRALVELNLQSYYLDQFMFYFLFKKSLKALLLPYSFVGKSSPVNLSLAILFSLLVA
jgi:hypothetical protein